MKLVWVASCSSSAPLLDYSALPIWLEGDESHVRRPREQSFAYCVIGDDMVKMEGFKPRKICFRLDGRSNAYTYSR